MALLDAVLGRIGASLGDDQTKSQSLLQAVLQQAGGLRGLANRFNTSGLAEVFNSWVSLDENGAIKPEQIEQVLGNQTVQHIAQKLGIDTHKAAETLAQLLPQVIDKLTPGGKIEDDENEEAAAKL